ncbi:hypothetical protein KCP78_07405 [Salmonella enterica subsp. enterica]|nr:hypothetical protein KCP78_07405 [Salmonella enterica subsp. enterica]
MNIQLPTEHLSGGRIAIMRYPSRSATVDDGARKLRRGGAHYVSCVLPDLYWVTNPRDSGTVLWF